jgi:hypothetical protein
MREKYKKEETNKNKEQFRLKKKTAYQIAL